MKVISIVLGGPTSNYPTHLLADLKSSDSVIGVDYGAKWLVTQDLKFDYAIGDFDSITQKDFQSLTDYTEHILKFPTKKDLTDSQLALYKAIDLINLRDETSEIRIYGATGGRLDHLLVNLFMVINDKVKPYANKIKLIDDTNYVEFVVAGKYQINFKDEFKYFSVVPLTAVKNLSIENAKYPLKNYSSSTITPFVSNEFVSNQPINIHLEEGIAAIIFSKD